MQKRYLFSVAMLVALLLGVSAPSLAISLDVTGNPYGQIGPYRITINSDVALPGLRALADGTVWGVCADISGGVPSGPWEVEKHALTDSSLAAGHLGGPAKFWEGRPNPSPFLGADEDEYRIGAWLADQVLRGNNREVNQRALWGLFKTDVYQGGVYDEAREDAMDAVDDGWEGWRSFAAYSPLPLEGPPGGTQQFFIRVPEAASLASLGLYFGGFGLLGYAFRRRMK